MLKDECLEKLKKQHQGKRIPFFKCVGLMFFFLILLVLF